jgi:hypothetical protein
MSKYDSLHALTRSFAKQTEEFIRHHEATYNPEAPGRQLVSSEDLQRAAKLKTRLFKYTEHHKNRHLWKRVPRCDELAIWIGTAISFFMLLFLVVAAILLLVKWF